MSETSPPPASAVLIPLHAVNRGADGTLLAVRRRPGRPRKVEPAPTLSGDERVYLEALGHARRRYVEASPILRSQKTEETLQQILVGLAEESASLRWEIERGLELGRNVEQAISRRIDCLHKMATTILGMRRLNLGTELRPGDRRMDGIVSYFVASVRGVLEGTLTPALSAVVMEQVEGRLRDWQRGHSGPL